MNRFFLLLAMLATSARLATAQNYQSQYPYDPYSGSPQPAPASNGGYATAGGGGYATGSGYESYSAPAGGYSSSSYSSGSVGHGGILSWGHLEGHYAYNDFQDSDLEGSSGFGLNLRVKLMNPLYLHFGLDRLTSSDARARDLEITSFNAAVGVFVPIGSRFQLYAQGGIRYDYVTGELDYINPDDASLYIRPGFRWAITDKFELTGSFILSETENYNASVFEVSAYYNLVSWLDIGGGVDFGDEVNTYRIGGRWRWD